MIIGPKVRAIDGGWVALGATLLVGAWALVASRQPTVVVASPMETVERLKAIGALEVATELGRTTWRAARGTLAGVAIGVGLGLVTGHSRRTDLILRPTRAVLTGAPPIVTLVLLSIWVGLDGDPTPYVVAAAAVPLMWIATHEAVLAVDGDLHEMSRALNVGTFWELRHVTLPAVRSPVQAAAAFVAANAVRVAIMSELFVSSDGVGARIARARTVLDTPEVFAWAVIAITTALIVEVIALRHKGVSATPGRIRSRATAAQ